MAALVQFWAILPSDVLDVNDWVRFGNEVYGHMEWMFFASLKYLQALNISQGIVYCTLDRFYMKNTTRFYVRDDWRTYIGASYYCIQYLLSGRGI